jgi:hypothetical protein
MTLWSKQSFFAVFFPKFTVVPLYVFESFLLSVGAVVVLPMLENDVLAKERVRRQQILQFETFLREGSVPNRFVTNVIEENVSVPFPRKKTTVLNHVLWP